MRKWISGLRRWFAGILARLFGRVREPSLDREFAMIDDYLRIQQLRQLEEQRFRRLYTEMHL